MGDGSKPVFGNLGIGAEVFGLLTLALPVAIIAIALRAGIEHPPTAASPRVRKAISANGWHQARGMLYCLNESTTEPPLKV